jgi:histidyl-tRNA synthetase
MRTIILLKIQNKICKVERMSEKFQAPRGTRDFLPEEMIKREFVINKLKKIFESYGFSPIETPAFENFELLAAKGGGGETIKDQIYYFRDKSDRELGLRFDLTVPLARIVANNPQLSKPFKRYCIGRVWRYEEIRKDRFREFWQCDIDTIGSSNMETDTEIISIAVDSLQLLDFKKFSVKLNNRKILTGLIELIDVPQGKKFDIFRAIDKLDKFGRDTVEKGLEQIGLTNKQIKKLLKLITLKGNPKDVIKKGEEILRNIKIGMEGLKELNEIVNFAKAYEFDDKIIIDFSLARGLDYYTGPIFEIVDTSGKNIGSLAGGGRYDNLIETLGGRSTPATGISLGIERIIEVMNEEKMFKISKTKVKVYIANVNEEVKKEVIKLASKLRENGIFCQTDLMNRNLKKQLEYADTLEIPFVVIVGPEELKKNKVKLKDMVLNKEMEVKTEDLVRKIKG